MINNFHSGIGFNELHNLIQGAVHDLFVIGDNGNADGRSLPFIVILDFGNGHIEFISNPGLDAFQHKALRFQ